MPVVKMFFLIFMFVAASPPAFSETLPPMKPKIVLLTSLNLTSMQPVFFKERYRTFNLKLEEQFREFFKNKNYRLDVTHFARQDEVWKAVSSGENAAVILLAHAGNIADQNVGIQRAALVDLYGYDMTPVLQGVHPQMRFLSVIGCNYKHHLDQLIGQSHSGLSTLFFDNKVGPEEGLKKTLLALEKALNAPPRKAFSLQQNSASFILQIKRKVPAEENEVYHPPVRIESSQGKVLGVFPRALPGEEQMIRISLPDKPKKLIVTAGNNPFVTPEDLRLGEFTFESSLLPGNWIVFADGSGQAFGTVSHIYHYRE